MTRDEAKLKALQSAETKVYMALADAEAGSETLQHLLEQANNLLYLQDRLKMGAEHECHCGGSCCGNAEVMPDDDARKEVVITPVADETPEPVENHTQAPEPPAAEPMTREEVLAILTPISNTAPDDLIPGVMAEMGYHRLSEIPADRYQELIDRVQEAMKGEGK